MVTYTYSIYAHTREGGGLALMKGIASREDARNALTQIIRQGGARKTRFMSLGDVIFDPDQIFAYEIVEREIYKPEEHCDCCLRDTEYESYEVVDIENAPTVDGAAEETPEEIAEVM